jgi:hypothetical protein
MDGEPSLVLNEHVVDHFCEQLRQAASLLGDLDLTANGHDRTASYHYLLQMVMYSIDAGVLGDEPLQPMFSAPYQIHKADWGAANPDAVYRRTWVREDLPYRIHGQLGNAGCFLIEMRRAKTQTLLNREDLSPGPDGTFEFFLGGPERSSNWMPMPPGTVGLSVREFFGNWMWAQRSRLRIDCLDGGVAPRPEANAQRVATSFDLSADWILGAGVAFWAEQSRKLAEITPNAFLPELSRTESKLPTVTQGWWDIDKHEALIIEFDDPQAQYWGVQLATSLWSTLEYVNRQTSLNMAQVRPDDDGKYRLVLSHRDPGFYNWLDTTGLRCGLSILRVYRPKVPQAPTTRLMNFHELLDALPGAPRASADDRLAQIAERREGAARLVYD